MRRLFAALAVLTCLSICGLLVAGDTGAWVAKVECEDGSEDCASTFQIDMAHAAFIADGGHNMFFGEGDATVLNVSDLADGETRIVGTGAKQVTVTRNGDEVRIERPARGDDSEVSIACVVDQDTCKIISFDDDPEKVMIMIQKTRTCIDGEGDCDAHHGMHFETMHGGEGHAMVITKTVECDDAGNCEETEDIRRHGGHGGEATVIIEALAGAEGNVFVHDGGAVRIHGMDPNTITLACPEKDATVRVDKEKADEVFLCPQHNVAMERQKQHVQMIRVEDLHTDDAD